MSWDVALTYPNDTIARVSPHYEGTTILLGGNDQAEMSVTYNYGRCWRVHGWGNLADEFNGKTARDTIPELRRMIAVLGTETDPDYWAATDGNAGAALAVMLCWAEEHPDAAWSVR